MTFDSKYPFKIKANPLKFDLTQLPNQLMYPIPIFIQGRYTLYSRRMCFVVFKKALKCVGRERVKLCFNNGMEF